MPELFTVPPDCIEVVPPPCVACFPALFSVPPFCTTNVPPDFTLVKPFALVV